MLTKMLNAPHAKTFEMMIDDSKVPAAVTAATAKHDRPKWNNHQRFSPQLKRTRIKGEPTSKQFCFSQPSSASWESSLCPLYHWMPLLTSPTCLGSQTHTRKSNAASQSDTPRANACCNTELASSRVSGKPPELVATRGSSPYLPCLRTTRSVKTEQIRAHGLLMTGWASDRVLEVRAHSQRCSRVTAS